MYKNLKSEHYLNGDSELKRILSTKSKIGELLSLKSENNFNMNMLNISGSDIFNGIFKKAQTDNKSMWLLQNQNVNNISKSGGWGDNDFNGNEDNDLKVDGTKMAEYDVVVDIPQDEEKFDQLVRGIKQIMDTHVDHNPADMEAQQWVVDYIRGERLKTLKYDNDTFELMSRAFLILGFTRNQPTKYTKYGVHRQAITKSPWETLKFKKYIDRHAQG